MNKLYNDDDISSIANAIRAKLGTTVKYKVSQMAQAIMSIVGFTPRGTTNITFNGIHDVSEFEKAQVNVPSDVYEPDTIVANGTYTPTGHDGFSKVVVNINDAPELQNKTITATSFPVEVTPDTGYYGLNKATVNYTPPSIEESVTVNIDYGTTATVEPTEGYDAMAKVVINASEPSGNINITANGTVDVTDYSQATVSVQPVLTTLTATSNGNYEPEQEAVGYSSVTVNVQPNLEDKTITQNGTYTKGSGYDGLGTVTVNVPSTTLQTLSVNANGSYNAPSGVSYNKVNVHVPIQEPQGLPFYFREESLEESRQKTIQYFGTAPFYYGSVSTPFATSMEKIPYTVLAVHSNMSAIQVIYVDANGNIQLATGSQARTICTVTSSGGYLNFTCQGSYRFDDTYIYYMAVQEVYE